ncbi:MULTISPECIES: NTTRR-F1 domain [Bacillus subtilis group]|uniref:Uncharacterized protein n=3 Tax=Bacillaceae TaxID=186817 RepID=M5PG31_9BACI|nr:hypothetical protein S101395_00999 [Bacillus sonorensis]EME75582.1 hypothetical protein BSONL12_07123 [Bacillus sonorensis L12]MBG9913933.1 hypothetical protein [Bacillus sonorensis]NWN80122.1 NTTRR-F1 domain [Bacillus sp. (in: firmicutes)]
MSIQNAMVNGGFETGTLAPWVGVKYNRYKRIFAFRFFLCEIVWRDVHIVYYTICWGKEPNFLPLWRKRDFFRCPQSPMQVAYFDSRFNFLGNGFFALVPSSRIPAVENRTRLEIYQTATPAPPGTTQAFILINNLPQAGTGYFSG